MDQFHVRQHFHGLWVGVEAGCVAVLRCATINLTFQVVLLVFPTKCGFLFLDSFEVVCWLIIGSFPILKVLQKCLLLTNFS